MYRSSHNKIILVEENIIYQPQNSYTRVSHLLSIVVYNLCVISTKTKILADIARGRGELPANFLLLVDNVKKGDDHQNVNHNISRVTSGRKGCAHMGGGNGGGDNNKGVDFKSLIKVTLKWNSSTIPG